MAEIKDNKYRDLEPSEVEALCALYFKHNGNCTKTAQDSECGFNRNRVAYYRDKYDFENKRLRNVALKAQEFKDKQRAMLMAGKQAAILKAIDLLRPIEIEQAKRDGTIVKFTKHPTEKAVKVAYDIIKTELGEPTTVSKNINVDDNPEIQEALNQLQELITKGQKDEPRDNKSTIQSGGQTPNDSTEVPPSV